MWDDEKSILAVQLRSSTWMEAIKSSSSSTTTSSSSSSSSLSLLNNSNQRNNINSLSSRINRSSPSINLIVNSDDDDYTVLPPSPPINRTPYSRLKGKARSRSSSRARTLETGESMDGPTSMIQDRQSTNHHHNQQQHHHHLHNHNLHHYANSNNYHSGRDFSSFDCYQIDNQHKMVNRNKSLNGSDSNLLNVNGNNKIRKNRENIYEILTSKKFMDTQKTIGSCNIASQCADDNEADDDANRNRNNQQITCKRKQQSQQKQQSIFDIDCSIIDADNLTNDALIEREWNKLVNGTYGNSLIRPLSPISRKLIVPNNNNNNNHSNSSLSSSTPTPTLTTTVTTTTTASTPSMLTTTTGSKVNKLNGVNHYHDYYDYDEPKRGKEMIMEEKNTAKIINMINNMNNQLNHQVSTNQHTNNSHGVVNNNNNGSLNCDEKSNITGTRFKEILKLYENLGKCSVYDSDGKVTNRKYDSADIRKGADALGVNGGVGLGKDGNEESVNHQQLKSTILQLDSVCQTRLKSIEECQCKINLLRDELRCKEEINLNLKAENDLLSGQLEEAQSGWKCEKERRLKENEHHKEVTRKLYARLDELNRELQESHINYDYLEMAYNRLKADVSGLQEIHSAEINLMRDRLNDLTAKLAASEKSLKNAKSYIGKLESRKRRSSSMRSSSRVEVNENGGGGTVSIEKTDGVESIKELSSSSSINTMASIPKDFQSKLQELEVKIARIQVILLANEHQSPDEGLPDIESINSFAPSSLPDPRHHHHHVPHQHHQQNSQRQQRQQKTMEISPVPTPMIESADANFNVKSSTHSSSPVKLIETVNSLTQFSQCNNSSHNTINENNLVKTR